MVQVRAPQHGRPVPRLLRVERDQTQVEPRRTSSSPTRRTASGSSTPRPTSGTCTTSTSTNPTSTSPIRKCRRRFHALSASGSSSEFRGFRVDAVPFLFAKDDVPGRARRIRPHQYLGDVRNFVNRRVGDAVLLGEVNLAYKDQKAFFGGPDGDGLNMQFDFIGMQNIYLVPRPRRRPPDRQGASAATEARPDEPVGQLRAQPRRAHPRQAERRRAPRGLRRLRPRAGHAALRPRAAATAALHARRRPAANADGLLAAFSLPGLRSSSTARRSGWPKTSTSQDDSPCARRCSGPAGDNGGFSKAQKRTAYPSPPRRPLRAGARQRRRPAPRPPVLLVVHAQPHLHVPAAAGDRLVDGRGLEAAQPARSWLTYAGRSRGGRWSRCTTSARTAAIVPIQLQGVPSGCILVDLLDGLTEHKLDSEGRIDVDLDGYGYRWLRLRRPEDEPII